MKVNFTDNRKGLSTAISGIFLVAVTVAYALVASSWISSLAMDALVIEELKVTNCQWSQDFSSAQLTIINSGAYGAKINGSGFGGTMFALAPNNEENVKDALLNSGSEAFLIKTSEGVGDY